MKSIVKLWNSGLFGKIAIVLFLAIAILGCGVFSPVPPASPPVIPVTSTISSPTNPTRTPVVSLPATVTSTSTIAAPPSLTPTLSSTETSLPIPPPASGDVMRFHFIDVGQGDSTLIQTPDGKVVLIDGGETDTGVVQYLQSIGIQRIDLMVATHPHSDHIGGLVQVLKAIPVAKVVTNGQAANTSVYEHFLDAIAAAQAEYVEVKRGDVIPLGSINFLVLSPVANTNSDTNENSVVLQFTYGRTTVLMMGDAGKDTEASLLASGLPLKANILKVGHHGSTSGSSPAFLNAVKPEIALYSAGINNSYHHPAPQTIAALNAVGAVVYGTDKDGAIIVSIDQNGYKIETQKNGNGAQSVVPISLPTSTQLAPTPDALEIVSITSPIPAGGNASLTAKTTPGASCSITVYYKSGPSKAQGLEPKTADGNGAVAWSWKVGIKTTPGTWKIVVTCNGLSQEIPFTVQ